jgi:hypothetical protein
MEQETVATPEPVAETVTQAPEAEQPTDDNQPLDTEQEQLEGQAPEDEFEDADWEGKPFKAPKGFKDFLKDGVLRQADYTKKTMTLAEQQKAWTAEKAATEAFTREVGTVMHMDDQLAQYEKVDWQAWYNSDPKAAEAARFNYGILKENRDNLARGLEAKVQERNAQAEQEYANRIEQERAVLSKPDPAMGWTGKFTPELKTELDTFARSQGYSDEHLARATALDVKTLNLAMIGMKTLKQQRALAKPPLTEAQPVPKIDRGRGNITGDPGAMDMERYAQWRKAGGGGGARR